MPGASGPFLSRRGFVAGTAFVLAAPVFAQRTGASDPADDWAWLAGNWDVWHRRLRDRLAGSTTWEAFRGKSAFWPTMGGLGNIDDNVVEFPGGTYRGLSIRAFDAMRRTWSIWWLDGRNPARIDPPVSGGFSGAEGVFLGRDTHNGRPVSVRFRWHDVFSARPHWDQALSTDGQDWEINSRNYFTRTSMTATPLEALDGAPDDFTFLAGRWEVRHRRLRQRLAGSTDWEEFGGTLVNWPVLGGRGNVGDNVMDAPSGRFRGMGIRAWNPETRQWLSWWLDGRNAGTISAPVSGGFSGGIGTFLGEDALDGRPILTRVIWSQITATSARWEQFASGDGGATWESNWVSDFRRRA